MKKAGPERNRKSTLSTLAGSVPARNLDSVFSQMVQAIAQENTLKIALLIYPRAIFTTRDVQWMSFEYVRGKDSPIFFGKNVKILQSYVLIARFYPQF